MKSNNIKNLNDFKNIYFIGIGGSGMFPMAQILKEEGFNITGADVYESDTLQKVRNLGIKVYTTHSGENIKGQDLIVFSAAIKETNPEIQEAKKLGIPMVERSVMLGIVFNKYSKNIGVSGTHGKTTTTSMITSVLMDCGKDPTAVIGASLKKLGGNSRLGKSDVMVAEACEYVDSFLQMNPYISIITNIEADHLDYFGTLENIIKSFNKFAKQTSGAVIIDGDNQNTKKAVENISAKVLTYGTDESNDYCAKNVSFSNNQMYSFDIFKKDIFLTHVSLNVPGKHNMYNALAAYIACELLGVKPEEFANSIKNFGGVHRRFEILSTENGITIADDFAHHPTEIEATLNTATNMGFKRVWAIFQPHTFSRTYTLLDDFAKSLSKADKVTVSDILPVRETNTWGVKPTDLTQKIPGAEYIPTFEEISEYASKNAQNGDLILTMGGGNVYKCAEMIKQKLFK